MVISTNGTQIEKMRTTNTATSAMNPGRNEQGMGQRPRDAVLLTKTVLKSLCV